MIFKMKHIIRIWRSALSIIYKRSFELPRINDCIVNNVPFDSLNKQKLKRPEFCTIYFSLICMYTKLLYRCTYKLHSSN